MFLSSESFFDISSASRTELISRLLSGKTGIKTDGSFSNISFSQDFSSK
jgi:hypothetical protein